MSHVSCERPPHVHFCTLITWQGNSCHLLHSLHCCNTSAQQLQAHQAFSVARQMYKSHHKEVCCTYARAAAQPRLHLLGEGAVGTARHMSCTGCDGYGLLPTPITNSCCPQQRQTKDSQPHPVVRCTVPSFNTWSASVAVKSNARAQATVRPHTQLTSCGQTPSSCRGHRR